MINDEILKRLFELKDSEYLAFQSKLIPTVCGDDFIGVRTPELRKLAKEFSKREDINDFLSAVPHRYFDENQLHAFIISEFKDYEKCVVEVETFLPYIDNWATCDQLSPKVFKKYRSELLKHAQIWIKSEKTYTVRFGIGMFMEHFLDKDFNVDYAQKIAEIRCEQYYINMMIAWYFATALAKQYDSILPFLEQNRLDMWTHNKTISKAVESRRITAEQKQYLKSLKIKKK